jgi:hypothetical protein
MPPSDYDPVSMADRYLKVVKGPALRAIVLCLAVISTSCSGSTQAEDPDSAQAPDVTVVDSSAGTMNARTEDGTSSTSGVVDDESEAPASGQETAEVLAEIESNVSSLGETLGASRQSTEQPSLSSVTSYPRLCPADDLAVSGFLQEDPLIENVPLQRYVMVFDTSQDAQRFFSGLAATEVGCVSERVGEVAIGTTTITAADAIEVADAESAVRIRASIEVDMIDFDQDPPGSDIVRSAAVNGAAVVVVVAPEGYETAIGVDDVHGPLLVDALSLASQAG